MFASAVIVFVGLAGKHPEKIEHQLKPVLAHAHVAAKTIAARELGDLARHTDASKDIVQQLHVDGVVGGALIESGGSLTLRLVIYDGDGNLKSLGETPLGGHMMSKDELEVLGENLDDELGGMVAKHKAVPALAEPDFATPKQAPTPAAAASDEISFDTDAPAQEDHHDAAPKESADAVSLDDVASLNNNADADATVTAESSSGPASSSSGLHLHANAGFGVASRSFSGPDSLMSYASSPVATAHLEAGLAPTEHLALNAMGESTLGMSSTVGKTNASTSMTRYEITASYALAAGSLSVLPTVGYGQRGFSIDSSSTDRTPDTSYGYFVLGANATYALTSKLSLRGLAAFEPVTGGDDPTAMEFGAATRWALDVGAGLEMRLWTHVVARAAFDYQQFSWSWAAAGTRAATSGTDSYPTGTVSVGAEY